MSSKQASLEESAQSTATAPVPQSLTTRFAAHLSEEIDTNETLLQMTIYGFMTGITSAVCFSACYLWPGFQTGGFVQLSLAVARLYSSNPKDYRFEMADRQALVSLLSFLIGTSLGRYGDKFGAKRRGWTVGATFFQALLLMAAALCAHFSGEPALASGRAGPSWTTPLGHAALGFASASLGLQGHVAKRLNTQFGTAVVLTTIWVELICDPKLFVLKAVKSRDHRIIACFSLFIGGLVGGSLVHTSISSAGTFGVATAFRLISVFSWFLVPAAKKS